MEENQNPTYPTTQENRPLETPPPPPDNMDIGPKTSYPNPRFMSKRMALIFLGIILLIFLISGGAYFLGKSSSNKGAALTPTPTTAKDMTGSGKLTPGEPKTDETSTWKTYANSEFDFSLKYPSDWKTTTPYDPTSSPYLDLNLGLAPSSKVKTGKEFVITVEHYDNPGNLSVQDWDKKENGEKPRGHLLYSSSTKPANLPGLTAYINENGDCEPVLCKEVIIMGDKKVIILRNLDFTNMDYTKEEIESYKPIFDQILNTFKFTN